LQIKSGPWTSFENGYRYFGRYAIVLLIQGSGAYEDDRGNRFDLEPGDITLVLPDLGHAYGPRENAVSHELFVVFDGSVFDGWYHEGILSADRVRMRLGEPSRWADKIIDTIIPDAQTETDALVEVTRLQQLLAEMVRATEVGITARGRTEWIRQAMKTIDASIPNPIDWDQVADNLGVSTVTLRRRFKDQLGFSPVTYRNRRLIGKACALMQQTDLSDQAIADALGFCDPHYFSRSFRRIIGASPRAYRARLP